MDLSLPLSCLVFVKFCNGFALVRNTFGKCLLGTENLAARASNIEDEEGFVVYLMCWFTLRILMILEVVA